MPSDPPPSSPDAIEPVDLVLVGALTIDRFTDGAVAPGGAVLHGARAAGSSGASVAAVTVAGGEPAAQLGLTDLRSLSRVVRSTSSHETTVFRHREGPDGRRLWLERASQGIETEDDIQFELLTHAVLFAPVLDEVAEGMLDLWSWTVRGASLQGWLRQAREGGEVRPIDDLRSLSDGLVERLARLDVLFASHEDLAMAAQAPRDQLRALRRRVGPGPVLIVTAGVEGAWIDIDRPDWRSRARWHQRPPRRVDGVAATGAGDAFAALFLLGYDGMPARREISDRALRAMNGVISMLERRRV